MSEHVSGPPPVQSEGRNFLGWILLGAMFTLLIAASLSSALQPGKTESKKSKYDNYDLELRLAASLGEFQRRFGNESELTSSQIANVLSSSVDELVDKAEKEPEAARYYAAMRREQGRPIGEKALKALAGSRDATDRAFARIYGPEKLTRKEAETLTKELKERGYVNQIATVHALEKAGVKDARSTRVDPWLVMRVAVIGMGMVTLLMLGGLVWLGYFYGRRHDKYAPLGHPAGRMTLRDADRFALRGAQILFAYLALSTGLGLLGSKVGNLSSGLALISGFGIIGIIILLSRFRVDGRVITLERLGLSRRDLGGNLKWGVAGFLAELPLTLMLGMIGMVLFSFLPAPSHPATEALGRSRDLMTVIPVLLLASISAPIWEEIFFRGLLFPAIGRLGGSVMTGAITSSLLFGLIHPQGPMLVLALSGVGFVSCLLAYQTRSLIPSIVMHLLHNTTIVLLGLTLLPIS